MSSLQTTLISPNPNVKTCKNPSSAHRRNDSGELDVFEAARYFSADNSNNNPVVEETLNRVHRSARMSLDVPMFRNPIHPGINNLALDHPKKAGNINKTAKYKQPSSPGARLASFLNSLFSQTASKKKKKSKSVGKDAEDDSGRRKRRSSISNFMLTRNPNSAAITPTKSYKEIRELSEPNRVPISAPGFAEKPNWKGDQKSRLSNGSMTYFRHGSLGFSDRNSTAERELRKFSDADDGTDTDSSSDLFDLPNHELDFYSNGLPVYGTTNVDRIRIVAPISSTATA